MTRRLLLALLPQAKLPAEPCPVQLFVGKGKDTTITFPHVAKDDIASVVAQILVGEMSQQLRTALNGSQDLTFVITTKCRMDAPCGAARRP